MHVLVINTEKSWRGGERQTLYNIMGFLQAGLQVDLLCRKGCPLSQKARGLGITVHEIGGTLGGLRWLATNAAAYDLIQAQTAKAQTLAAMTKPFHGKPIVYTRRVDFVPRGRLTKIKYRSTDHVVAISNWVKTILENFGIPNITVISDVVVPRALDSGRAAEIVAKVDAKGKKIVATFAALEQHKDPLTMIEAVRGLSRLRDDFVFLHFGDGSLRNTVQQKIDEYRLNDVYHLMGFVSEVEDVFLLMDVFCMSSEEEGLGSSVLDAFAYKVPVVSTAAGGLAEIVAGRGLLCNIKDSGAMAECIDKVLEHPEEYRKTAERAYDYVVSAHSLESTTEQYLELFKGLADRERGRP
ncbi:glycosyltransferase family 4 protein [Oryzomonas sagensis]|nr:glycosyltransferase family 4 protein [Oryzomonas sagensis]